ncbi:MAG: aminopeptidase P family protein [Chloroflexi bacterium]|nr:aminopeptidase P family protein [Chloroflexota bacterium]
MTQVRLSRILSLMKEMKIQAIALNAGSNLKYLTGLDFHLSERPVILLITMNGQTALFFPNFERAKAESSLIELELYPYSEDPETWVDALRHATLSLHLGNHKIAVPPESMRFLELDLLRQAIGHQNFISSAALLKELLVYKDSDEIDHIKKAISIAESAIEALISETLSGQSESAVANKLVIKLLELGSAPELPFNPIIASGPNSANPHAVPGDRLIQEGDIVVIDWGATAGGYISDITRTFQIGPVDQRFQQISEIVLQANLTGRNQAQPGIRASLVDSVTRKIITDAGYGAYFTHRTGHGIGMLAHEEPYISESSETILSPGMVFTVEPGIYIPGAGGIRIEDNVLITSDGSLTLTGLPRELRSIK